MLEGGHWYDENGKPRHFVNNRPVNIAMARNMGLFPSVTTVMKVCRNVGIDIWRQRKIIEIALSMSEGTDYDDVLERAFPADSMELGSSYHSDIARLIRMFDGCPDVLNFLSVFEKVSWDDGMSIPRETAAGIYEVWKDLGLRCENYKRDVEVSFANNKYGYGGSADVLAVDDLGRLVVIDWKTQGTEGKSLRFYPTWAVQLAAYANSFLEHNGIVRPPEEVRIVSVAMSSTDKNLVKVKEWGHAGSDGWFDLFLAMLTLWKSKLFANYDPLGGRNV